MCTRTHLHKKEHKKKGPKERGRKLDKTERERKENLRIVKKGKIASIRQIDSWPVVGRNRKKYDNYRALLPSIMAKKRPTLA